MTNKRIEFDLGFFELYIPNEEKIIDAVIDIPGARWSSKSQCWIAPNTSGADVAIFAKRTKIPIADSCLDEFAKQQKQISLLQKSYATEGTLEVELLKGKLLPFQKAGVEYATTVKRCFIADEMGLGKTVQAIASLEHTKSFPAVIVCPASVKLNWEREINKWLIKPRVQVLNGTKGSLYVNDIYIINYDVLTFWVDKFHKIKAAIFDESHYAKNPLAKRTKACFNLADKVDDDGLILCLTGTPILNNPSELVAQLRILRKLKEFGGAKKFRETFNSISKLPSLNSQLRKSMYIRRKKSEVMKDLPDKRWSDFYIEGNQRVMQEYAKAENDLITYLVDVAIEAQKEEGVVNKDLAWQIAIRAQAAQQLVAINTLRQLSAKAKMENTKEWIKDFLQSGKKLVVFTWHTQPAKELIEEFKCPSILGETSIDDRQKNIEQFQNNPDVKLIVCSIKAAGIGITLTEASNVLFIESGWTPADMDQAVDRCHRIGQKDSVTAWWLLIEDTIDEDIKKLIEEKRVIVNATVEGSKELQTGGAVGDLLVNLTKKALKQEK